MIKDQQKIFDDLEIGLFTCDMSGKISYANDTLSRLLGYPGKNDLQGHNFLGEFFNKSDDAARFIETIDKNRRLKSFKALLKKANGSRMAVSITASRLLDPEKGTHYIEGAVQDITKQLQKELELKKITAEKNDAPRAARHALTDSETKLDYLRELGHEMRTPMNSIIGYLTLLENGDYETEKEAADFASHARATADSMMELVNNFIEISMLETGSMQLLEASFNPREEIGRIKALVLPFAFDAGIDVNIDVDPNMPLTLFGDAGRFRQTVVLILRNAIRQRKGNKINIGLRLKDTSKENGVIYTMIAVSGAAKDIDRYLELFKPSQAALELPNYTGSEVWLLLSREILNMMNGEIAFSSKDDVLFIRLTNNFRVVENTPALKTVQPEPEETPEPEKTPEAEEKQKPAPGKKPEQTASKNGKRLLLVEDDQGNQRVELEILRNAGYNVDPVSSGRLAVEAASTGKYDLILMDIGMEDMDGITATKKIRELEGELAEVPIIAVTAHCSMEDRQKCIDAGMDDYISKPINFKYLKITIEQWLNRKSF